MGQLSHVKAIRWTRDGRVGVPRAGGGRYLIHRWDGKWIIHYLPPPGHPVAGVAPVSVPWAGTRRSLAGAQESCAGHARQLAAAQSGDRSPSPTRD
jgi:hypothetical protein